MNLFKRDVQTVVTPRLGGDSVRFKLRTHFVVEKSEDSAANKATISIFNLSDKSAKFVGQKERVMRLEAGYDGTREILFNGDVSKSYLEKKGGDTITTMEAADGGFAISTTRVELSLGPGATNRQVFSKVSSALNIAIGSVYELPIRQYLKGFAYSGSAKELLDRLVKNTGYLWSIQNCELQVTPEKTGTSEVAAYLSNETGLIGVPTMADKGGGIKFESLLNPKVSPGRWVKIKSKIAKIDGFFKVQRVVHEGDSEEGTYSSKGEGVSVG